MRPSLKKRRGQFSLRSLLAGITWLALLLAICVQYQHAAARQRMVLESFKVKLSPPSPVGGPRPIQTATAPLPHDFTTLPDAGDGRTR